MAKSSRSKALAQFWTPPAVAEFMLEIVQFDPLWKVIDPACGEGVFLQKAAERDAGALAGVDIDPNALERARQALHPYGERVRLYCQDGLQPIDDPNPFWRGEYDLVIGNPPFAATGYRIHDPRILQRFELSSEPVDEPTDEPDEQGQLFEYREPRRRRKSAVAIEILYLERFSQLCRHGGRICIILPDGVLANRNTRYVRQWILQHHHVYAVISLPRNTFKGVETSAKTSILVLQKGRFYEKRGAHMMILEQVNPDAPFDREGNPELVSAASALRKWLQFAPY